MKENLLDKIKAVGKSVLDFIKKHLFITVISAFVIVALAVILTATIGMQEFVVPVCVLVMIEAAMAVLLRNSEIWVHGVVMIVQIAGGLLIRRFPLTALCVVVYVAATVVLVLLSKEDKSKEKSFKSKVKVS